MSSVSLCLVSTENVASVSWCLGSTANAACSSARSEDDC